MHAVHVGCTSVCKQELIADEISPGLQLSAMLPDILADAACLTTLSLAGNQLDDTAIRGLVLALADNEDLQLQHLDLSGNQMLPAVSSRWPTRPGGRQLARPIVLAQSGPKRA